MVFVYATIAFLIVGAAFACVALYASIEETKGKKKRCLIK